MQAATSSSSERSVWQPIMNKSAKVTWSYRKRASWWIKSNCFTLPRLYVNFTCSWKSTAWVLGQRVYWIFWYIR